MHFVKDCNIFYLRYSLDNGERVIQAIWLLLYLGHLADKGDFFSFETRLDYKRFWSIARGYFDRNEKNRSTGYDQFILTGEFELYIFTSTFFLNSVGKITLQTQYNYFRHCNYVPAVIFFKYLISSVYEKIWGIFFVLSLQLMYI